MQDQSTSSGSASSHPKIRFSTSTPLGAGGSATGGAGGGADAAPDSRRSISTSSSPGPAPTPTSAPTPAAAYDGAPATTIVASSKIRTNERSMDHGGKFSRKPNSNGTGAIHVRTFHSKLNDESLAYLDQQINEWLDQHPEYEVKFSVSTIGMYTGKVKEPAVICQVWV